MYEFFDSFMCAGESTYSLALDMDKLNNHFMMEKYPFVNPGRGVGYLPSFGNNVMLLEVINLLTTYYNM